MLVEIYVNYQTCQFFKVSQLESNNINKYKMAENEMGKLLPNLKITLGSDTDSDNQIEEGELSDTIDDLENICSKTEGEERKVDMVRSWMKELSNPKVYENKAGAFITGLDLSYKVLGKKLQERSGRFGVQKREKPITQKEIDALYKSLGIEPENIHSSTLKNIRLEALHMRGVDEMDTKDIFAYFGDYGPASVEWINDCSCNVVWLDAATTARAIIGMSRPFIIKKKNTTKQGITESLAKEDEVKSSEAEDIIEVTDSEEDDYNDKKEFDEVVDNSMEVDSLSDSEKPDDLGTKNDSSKVPAEVVDVPVPPGYWRLGVSHPKSKAILLRFATKDDKKLPGAEKRSQYYQKYGNPNYGGLKGLISSSRKRKMQAARNRQVVEKISEDFTSQSEINSGEKSKRTIIKANRSKMPRMRMYADDEEEKNRKGSFMRYESGRRSVHSRLGTKYTKDDLFQLGNRFSSESDEDDDNISINCTVPSRFNIWTDLAKSMAKEDNYRARSTSPDSELFDLRKSRNNRATRNRSFARDWRSPESKRGSRPWRPSRDDSKQDLRSSLNFHRRQRSPLNKPQEDLRSKIKRIKKEDTVNKHRSPMFMDD